MRALMITCLLLAPGAAAAAPVAPVTSAPEEPSGFVAAGVLIGGDRFLDAALTVEGGVFLVDRTIVAQALLAAGDASDPEGGGGFARAAGGVEARMCTPGGWCPFAGVLVGFEQQTWVPANDTSLPTEHHRTVIAGARFGLDLGGAGASGLRFRAALEVYGCAHHTDERGEPCTARDGGGALTLGLGLQY